MKHQEHRRKHFNILEQTKKIEEILQNVIKRSCHRFLTLAVK